MRKEKKKKTRKAYQRKWNNEVMRSAQSGTE